MRTRDLAARVEALEQIVERLTAEAPKNDVEQTPDVAPQRPRKAAASRKAADGGSA